MERLTDKDIAYITSGANVIEIPDIVEGHKYTGQAIIKLGKYEDIEERYELPLPIFIKILIASINKTNINIYFKNDPEHFAYNIMPEETLNLDEKCIEGYDNFTNDGYYVEGQFFEERLYFKDYGKTWVLVEEGLELNK